MIKTLVVSLCGFIFLINTSAHSLDVIKEGLTFRSVSDNHERDPHIITQWSFGSNKKYNLKATFIHPFVKNLFEIGEGGVMTTELVAGGQELLHWDAAFRKAIRDCPRTCKLDNYIDPNVGGSSAIKESSKIYSEYLSAWTDKQSIKNNFYFGLLTIIAAIGMYFVPLRDNVCYSAGLLLFGSLSLLRGTQLKNGSIQAEAKLLAHSNALNEIRKNVLNNVAKTNEEIKKLPQETLQEFLKYDPNKIDFDWYRE